MDDSNYYKKNKIQYCYVLGPKGTDSVESLEKYLKINNKLKIELKMNKSFHEIFANINIKNTNNFIWVPIALKDEELDIGNLIYLKNAQLKLIDIFENETKEMILAENLALKNNKAIIQPATINLVKQNIKEQIKIENTKSKKEAYNLFKNNQYQYSIFSNDEKLDFQFKFKVKQLGAYNMIWLLFLII